MDELKPLEQGGLIKAVADKSGLTKIQSNDVMQTGSYPFVLRHSTVNLTYLCDNLLFCH